MVERPFRKPGRSLGRAAAGEGHDRKTANVDELGTRREEIRHGRDDRQAYTRGPRVVEDFSSSVRDPRRHHEEVGRARLSQHLWEFRDGPTGKHCWIKAIRGSCCHRSGTVLRVARQQLGPSRHLVGVTGQYRAFSAASASESPLPSPSLYEPRRDRYRQGQGCTCELRSQADVSKETEDHHREAKALGENGNVGSPGPGPSTSTGPQEAGGIDSGGQDRIRRSHQRARAGSHHVS